MENDRRFYPRIRCNGVAALDLGDGVPCTAQMLDLSAEGCHLMFDSPPHIHPDAEIFMTFEVENIPFDVRAKAQRVGSGSSIGVYFSEMADNSRADLQALVSLMALFNPQSAANYS